MPVRVSEVVGVRVEHRTVARHAWQLRLQRLQSGLEYLGGKSGNGFSGYAERVSERSHSGAWVIRIPNDDRNERRCRTPRRVGRRGCRANYRRDFTRSEDAALPGMVRIADVGTLPGRSQYSFSAIRCCEIDAKRGRYGQDVMWAVPLRRGCIGTKRQDVPPTQHRNFNMIEHKTDFESNAANVPYPRTVRHYGGSAQAVVTMRGDV